MIARNFQKIFCDTLADVTQFGSNLTTPVFTKTLSTIQALAAWGNGLAASLPASKTPFIQDLNAIFYVITKQLAYLFQAGVPEWDSETEYHLYSIVQFGGKWYYSLSDTNLNHEVNTAWWGVILDPADAAVWNRLAVSPTAARAIKAVSTWTGYSYSTGPKAIAHNPNLGTRNGLTMAVGANACFRSTNGLATMDAITNPGNTPTAICYIAEYNHWVCVGIAGTNRVQYSSNDGASWNGVNIGTNSWAGVAWSPELGRVVIVTSDYANTKYSDNGGVSWSNGSGVGSPLNGVCWARELGKFIAVGYNRIVSSTNGVSWVTHAYSGGAFKGIAWAPEIGTLVAVGDNGVIQSSIDGGVTWNARTSPGTGVYWTNVTWSPELRIFMAVAEYSSSGSTRFASSPDGVTWTERTAPSSAAWCGVCWAPDYGRFFAVADTSSTQNRARSDMVQRFWR